MAEIVGVRFKGAGKVYYFDPDDKPFSKGESVIVETARGIECGEVAMENREVPEDQIVKPLKMIIRTATPEDLKIVAENRAKEKDAFQICLQKIAAHKLEMKLVEVEYTFDRSVFRTRIELRQIGVRDESKLLGGLGICGRPFCCSTFLGDFQSVSIKMAKEQGISLNPVKISGTCGRLMCCLKYEQNAYEHLLRVTPKNGAIVDTKEGRGVVIDANLLTGILKIRLHKRPDAAPVSIHRKEVRIVKDAQVRVPKEEEPALKELE